MTSVHFCPVYLPSKYRYDADLHHLCLYSDPAGFTGHGTEDNDLEPRNNPPAQARALRDEYRNDPAVDLLAPYRNAESIAAAALGK